MSEQVEDVVDIEAYARAGRAVPHARLYRVRIDKKSFEFDIANPTGRQILEKAGKVPAENYILRQIMRGGQAEKVGLDQHVDLTRPGVERFKTIPRDVNDGAETPRRRAFALPPLDIEYLETSRFDWETVESGGYWLIIYGFPLPQGYTQATVDVAIRIDPNYPDNAGLDMAFFCPSLCRADGRSIPSIAHQDILGRSWQMWSRHRTGANPWRIGEDDLQTHLDYMENWLMRELERA